QQEIADVIGALRRLADVSVVMNARLYEVDRAFYSRHAAPLFAGPNGPAERQTVIAIEGPLLRAITQQKLLLETEERKLRPNQKALVLSRQPAFRSARGSRPDGESRPLVGTGLEGVSFEVRPLVSPDRRYLRLHLAQKVVQLVGVEKAKTLETATGKELEVE